ncbi:MAG TPA: hypothetical protein VMT46_20005 [Anaerolineaceae bacterium]|nr:hypothetical protein [Anaerolineaceae bacterium]
MKEDVIDQAIREILNSKKYRGMNLCADTLRDVLEREVSSSGRSQKEALKAARQKLHNIVAPYLGDPDYPAAERELETAFASRDVEAIRAVCTRILAAHASTRERISILDDFYTRIFAATGKPAAILDAACGLNPLTFPWMSLPLNTRYHAYDIHGPRVEFLNHYFHLQGLAVLAEQRDVLVHPPEERGELAFLFKEAHRFEQRQRGCNAPLWDALRVRYLLVSLPTHSLSGRFDLVDRQRQLVREILGQRTWLVGELLFENEIVFCIDKGHG